MSLAPYTGITDFTSVEQAKDMLDVFQKSKPQGSHRKLHVGVMMSYKTLHDIETKWSKAFPKKESIADIFSLESPDLFHCLHYADYSHTMDFYPDLIQAMGFGGKGLHAVQLDMIWPSAWDIGYAVHVMGKPIEVILQVGKDALKAANDDPAEVVHRLEKYKGIIQRVLLDKSMGKGLGMDALALRSFARAIRDRFPELGLVVAGGLGPDTMHLLGLLPREISDLSIDAQGKLRPSGSALDPIEWPMAATYLTKAPAFFPNY